jgi:hypothetical protein
MELTHVSAATDKHRIVEDPLRVRPEVIKGGQVTD